MNAGSHLLQTQKKNKMQQFKPKRKHLTPQVKCIHGNKQGKLPKSKNSPVFQLGGTIEAPTSQQRAKRSGLPGKGFYQQRANTHKALPWTIPNLIGLRDGACNRASAEERQDIAFYNKFTLAFCALKKSFTV